MKWAFLICACAATFPFAGWLRNNPQAIPKVLMLFGFLVVQHGPLHFYMAIISWSGYWPGYVQGLEISLLDLLALAIYINLPRVRTSPPFLPLMALYFVAVLISIFQVSAGLAVVFYLWQIARVAFIFVVVRRACADEAYVLSIVKGLAVGLLVAAVLAIWQRFGLGILQTAGSFDHRNMFGVISYFVTFPVLSLLLAGQRGLLYAIVPVAGIMLSVLTTSRATVAFTGLGFIGLFLLSAFRGWTSRKQSIALVGAIVIIVIAPLAISSFEKRFEGVAEVSLFEDEARVAMELAASMMLAEHPMGIGANHYVIVANTQGYNPRAGVSWTSGRAHVHNVYWLVAAETGYLGLVTFLLMLLRPLQVAFLCGWRHRHDTRGDLLLGVGVALLVVYLHSYFEWVFIAFQAQYLWATSAGLVAGLAGQLGYFRPAKTPQTKFSADFSQVR